MPTVNCPCCGHAVYDASTARRPGTRSRWGSVKALVAGLRVGEVTVFRGSVWSARTAARQMGMNLTMTQVERGVYLVRRKA